MGEGNDSYVSVVVEIEDDGPAPATVVTPGLTCDIRMSVTEITREPVVSRTRIVRTIVIAACRS